MVDKSKLRVYAFTRKVREKSPYIGFYEESVQQLQKKTLFGWSVIDEEIVPADVKIALGATGYNSSNWESKFYAIGEFGRDGAFK